MQNSLKIHDLVRIESVTLTAGVGSAYWKSPITSYLSCWGTVQ